DHRVLKRHALAARPERPRTMRHGDAVSIRDQILVIDREEMNWSSLRTDSNLRDRPIREAVRGLAAGANDLETAPGIGGRQTGPPHEVAYGGRVVTREEAPAQFRQRLVAIQPL